MHDKSTLVKPTLFAILLGAAPALSADDAWYVGLNGAFTDLDVSSLDVDLPQAGAGRASIDTDSGYGFGFSFGRELAEHWRVELEYNYRSNDVSSISLPAGEPISEGDYASTILAGNVHYLFRDAGDTWRPYLGAGFGWITEVDLDLRDGDANESFSGDGTAWQVMGGVSYRPSDNWRIDFEARYLGSSDITLDPEAGAVGSIRADYSLYSIGASLKYAF
jgi:opacity protein-like surface antigen